MNGIIIEGLAGTGKSSVINLLMKCPNFQNHQYSGVKVFDENVTLGELVTEMRIKNIAESEHCKRLETLFPAIEQAVKNKEFVILERFHLSYFALMPAWSLVQKADEFLASLDMALTLLHFPDNMIENRCFHRPELPNPYLQNDLINWYGTKQKALAAFMASQQNRHKAMALSRLRTLSIDTSEKNWEDYVQQISSFVA